MGNGPDISATRSPEVDASGQFIRRWSPRAFAPRALSLAQLSRLVEAARWSPSCFNSQPWRFVYALRDSESWDNHLGLLMDMNQVWARNAGALVAMVAKTTFDDGSPAPTASFDTGTAWMSMALEAQAMGLISHAMWGFHHDRAATTLGLPADHAVQAMVAFGYPGDKADLPEKYQAREMPSPRKSIQELLFEGKLGPE